MSAWASTKTGEHWRRIARIASLSATSIIAATWALSCGFLIVAGVWRFALGVWGGRLAIITSESDQGFAWSIEYRPRFDFPVLPAILEWNGRVYWGIPLWMLLVLFLIPFAVFSLRGRRHGETNCCRQCGYTLFGNQSGICPECGNVCQEP